MHAALTSTPNTDPVPVVPLTERDLRAWRDSRDAATQRWLDATGFDAKPGAVQLLPRADGTLGTVVVGVAQPVDPWSLAGLPASLPAGCYRVDADWPADRHGAVALGWALGCYEYDRYRTKQQPNAVLAVHEGCDAHAIGQLVAGVTLARDWINTPPNDLMPEQLGDAVQALADEHGGRVERIVGDDLLERGFPAIHAVGRASAHRPELVDLTWGEPDHPMVTLVGKGVCFDTGGLDLKSAANMRLMKKDMGGAAHAAGLARAIMGAALPVRLRLLVSAVENAVAGNAYRPGDVLRTRKGTTVEVDNTDAEGRIVLSDALTLAAEEAPDLIVDFSTLTGAARVALGTDLPAYFSNRDDVAADLEAAAATVDDPVWRLPLHRPYRDMLDSRVADICNSAGTPYAGAITAALFLEHFVGPERPWVHFDLMAWNTKPRPGRPEGGEAMGLRAVYELLRRRYGT